MDFLIVDDDRLICEGIARRLAEMAGMVEVGRVHSRYSGEEALAFLTESAVDILITDIRMYEMDGLSLIARAKALRADMGCIIVTAYHDLEYAQQAIRLGVDDFLLKPYSIQTMRETVLRVSARLRTQRERTDRQLSRALRIGMSQPGVMPQALFAEHGIACPASSAFLAIWAAEQGALPEAPEGIWQYPVAGEPCMLCWHAPERAEAFGDWLQGFAEALGASVGLSLPGGTLAEMAKQGQEALALAWYWTSPRAIFYAPKAMTGNDATQKLIRHVRTLHLQSARDQWETLAANGFLQDPRRAETLYRSLHSTLTQLCAEYELDAPELPLLPAPQLGFREAFLRLFCAGERAVAGLADESVRCPVSWAKRYAREHLHEAVGMSDIARKLKLSYTYFSKLFKDQTGVTFTEYLQDLRIREAKRLLIRGMNVSEVASQVGYTSVYNFSRAFAKNCGIAPAKWRRETARAGGPE